MTRLRTNASATADPRHGGQAFDSLRFASVAQDDTRVRSAQDDTARELAVLWARPLGQSLSAGSRLAF
jgi:hypothetical protein